MIFTRKKITNICLVFGLVMVFPFLEACQEKQITIPAELATQKTPALSPSGKYKLVVLPGVDEKVNIQYFQIKDRNNQVLYSSIDKFSVYHTTYFLWDKDDRVWVYSGDVGTFFWEFDLKSKKWEKHSYGQSNVPVPNFLKEMRPQFFSN